MKMKRIFSLIMAVAMVVTVLSACSLGNSKVSVPGTIDEEGRFIFTVIRGDASGQTVESAAKDVRAAIKENFDCKVTISKDSAVENLEGSYEILVGDTDRPESDQARQVLKDNRDANAYDFVVKVIGTKICIQATTDDMVAVACKWFIDTFCDDLNAWALLKEDYQFLYAPSADTISNKVGGVDLGLYTIVKPLEYSYVIGKQVDELRDFYKLYGFSMAYLEDIDPETSYEILVGNTDRAASKAVSVEGDNYVIKVVGTKLVVKGGTDLATYRGMKAVVDAVKASKDGNYFDWSDGYVQNGKYDPTEEHVYTLNFYDDFDAPLNTTIWGDYNYAHINGNGASCLGGTQYHVDPMNNCQFPGGLTHQYIYTSDGSLVMTTEKVSDVDFVASAVSTFMSMLYKYGIYEVRGMQGKNPGAMSYWLNGTGEQNLRTRYGDITRSCMTEVDLIETYGSQNSFGSNVHRWWVDYSADMQSSQNGHNSMGGSSIYHTNDNNMDFKFDSKRYGGDLSTDYHTYTYYWDDECMKFGFDGKIFCDYQYVDEQSVSVHCLLNYLIFGYGMGSASYGATWKKDVSPELCEARIDSVKIYQTDAINSQMVQSVSEYVKTLPETKIQYPNIPIKGTY